ncbi:aspartyl protease family protein At5g10770-like [Triticum urartu]|uniref:aspartyl protease family protein At5g10770-like n=1 Tax=Triticum urartu TaxID=4572 RepID=UPI002044B550|nr:aspartyl protease family protein At5g10770-like [Triticum urartu]
MARTKSSRNDLTLPTTLGLSLGTLQHVITVGIGSPAVNQTMFIDTGSDVSWVQCKPCSRCHSQADSLFDPSLSSTYSPFTCSSAACAQLRQDDRGNGCSGSQCQYILNYGDASRTTGSYSSDTLSLGSNAVSNFKFRCNQSESCLLLHDQDQTAGLIELGGGAQSLATQTSGTFGKAFSYCLPLTPGSSGFLTMGVATSGFVVKTPLLRSRQVPEYYGVKIKHIRIGTLPLHLPSGLVLDLNNCYLVPALSMNIISGSCLMQDGYSFKSAFRAGMKQYPPAQPMGILDTCFDFSGQSSIRIPTIALMFSGGAVVNLSPEGIILESCLAFAANRDDSSLGIIGNVQQRMFEVLYDVGGGAVGFNVGAC